MRRRVGSRGSRRPEGSIPAVGRTAVVDGCARSSAGVASRQCGSNQAIKPPGRDLAVRNRRRTFAVVSERLGRHGCLRGVLRQRCLDHREVSVHADAAGGRDPVDREVGVGSRGHRARGRAGRYRGRQWALACTSQPTPPHGPPAEIRKALHREYSVRLAAPDAARGGPLSRAIDADDAWFRRWQLSCDQCRPAATRDQWGRARMSSEARIDATWRATPSRDGSCSTRSRSATVASRGVERPARVEKSRAQAAT